MADIDNTLRFRQLFASVIRLLSFSRRGRVPEKLRSIAILTPECFGDCILLTALLRQLRDAVPDLSIHLVTFRKSTTSFFADDPHVSSVFYVKSGFPAWIRYCMTHRFDVLFSPKDSLSVNFLLQSYLLRATFKVAHRNEFYEGIFDRLIDMDYFSHVVLRNGALLKLLNLPLSEGSMLGKPYLPPMPVSAEVEAFCGKIGTQQLVGVNLSAGSRSKQLDRAKWRALIESFPEERFMIFSAPDDRQEKEILERLLSNVEPSPPTANLGEVGAILKGLKFLVSPDTSLVHVAACYDLPVVVLYRNIRNDIERFSPLSSRREMVVSPDCFTDALSGESVIAGVQRMIDGLLAGAACEG